MTTNQYRLSAFVLLFANIALLLVMVVTASSGLEPDAGAGVRVREAALTRAALKCTAALDRIDAKVGRLVAP